MRGKLLLAMLACAALLAGVVIYGSPYAPVIEPVAEIEAIWAIEDTRTESETPLVTALENHGARLGYDAAENTFYCPIGLETGNDWPEIHLTAPGAKDVRLVFVDDYSYDWCSDALRDGYGYQIMAYTDTEFSYAQIVFTGLPVVTMQTHEEIGYENVKAGVSFCAPGSGLKSGAVTHLRGAGSRFSEKKSYKIDFVHGTKDSTAYVVVPGLGSADDVILLAGVMDDSLMRDKLSWDLYAMIAEGDEPYGPRDTQYVELFVNDSYMGLYLMMEPVDDGEELVKAGVNAPATDSVYRTAQIDYAGERAYVENPMREGSIYELYHAPAAGHEFDALAPYLALEQMEEEDEAEFERLVMQHVDLESILRYYLFVQGGGMSDNVYNNMYVIANRRDSKLTYRFAPWDMDLTWGRFKDGESGDFYHDLFSFGVVQRMLEIDAGGVTRETLCRLWDEMRATAMNETIIEELVNGYVQVLDASGAYTRDALRWRGDAYFADGWEILLFAQEHLPILDAVFDAYRQ